MCASVCACAVGHKALNAGLSPEQDRSRLNLFYQLSSAPGPCPPIARACWAVPASTAEILRSEPYWGQVHKTRDREC